MATFCIALCSVSLIFLRRLLSVLVVSVQFLSSSVNPPEWPERGGWLLKLRKMGTHGVHMKGVLPMLVVRWARSRCAGTRTFFSCCAGTRTFFSCLGCSSQSSTKYFFLTIILLHLSPAQQAGQQYCRAACLLINAKVVSFYFLHGKPLNSTTVCNLLEKLAQLIMTWVCSQSVKIHPKITLSLRDKFAKN